MADNLTYSQGSRSLIFIGDVAHDRFSLNKDADFIIRENIHNNGGIFVLGNHDYIESCSCLKSAQTGKAARNTISEDVWKSYEKNVFVNCYYDEKNRTLYIHNGLSSDGDKIESGFTEVDAKSYNDGNIQDLVNYLNDQEIDKSKILKMTRFRPTRESVAKAAGQLGIRIVHGHNGVFKADNNHHVVSLNARVHHGFYPCSILLGENGS